MEPAMFTPVSPLAKALVLSLSAGLTFSIAAFMAQGRQSDAVPAPARQVVQLAPVVVIGHRDAVLAEEVPDAKLSKAAPTGKDTAI
jgi:hypothetical protein